MLQHIFLELVREAKAAGQTVFMSSHVLSEVQQTADRVGIIRDGRMVAVESVEALRRRAVRRVEIHFDEPVRPDASSAARERPGRRDRRTRAALPPGRSRGRAGQGRRSLPGRQHGHRGARPRGAVLHLLPGRGGVGCCVACSPRRCGTSGARIIGWSIGIAAVGVFYAAFYPSMANPDMAAAMEAFPEGMLDALGFADITSPAGYLAGTTYGLLGPVLMIIFASTLGARAIAGEEEAGRLDVLLAHPIDRWSVVVQRAAALLVALAVAGIALFLVMTAAAGPAQFDEIGVANLGAATVQLVLLGAFFGALALSVGAVTGRRGLALAAVAIVGIATYFANTLGPSVEAIAWSRDASPFHYYSGGQPLVNGWQLADGLILLVATVGLVALGVVGFRRRDVAV